MLRIFHTSDIHIGLTFRNYPDVREKLIEARFGCLERMINISNERMCDLFVIAGDLFDNVFVPKKSILRVLSILKGFQGRFILILPGNHDFILPEQVDFWSFFKENSPDNVILLEKKEPYDFSKDYGIEVCVYPSPCNSKNSSENPIAWIFNVPRNYDKRLHIGIAHGSLEDVSIDFEERYYPMKREELLKCGLDLWLLGHTHIQYPSTVRLSESIFYAGTPEPDGFDCRHGGRAWMFEIDDNKVIKPVSISTGKYSFLHEEFLVNDEEDVNRLVDTYLSDRYKDTLLKLRLKGRLKEGLYDEMHESLKRLRDNLFYVNFIDEVKKEITLDIINKEFTEGSFPYRLLTSFLEEPEILQLAYDLVKGSKK